MNDSTVADVQADFDHGLLERIPFFGLFDDINASAQHLNAEFLEYAMLNQIHCCIQTGLAAQSWQQGIRSFDLDDLRHVLPGNRLDVRTIGHFGVGHDRRGVRVDQDNLVTLFAKRFACLGAGIIKFASLPDDNRARTNDQNLMNVVATGHGGGP